MEPQMILPMFAMVLLTFFVLIYGLRIRVSAVKTGAVDVSYFKTFQTEANVPVRLLQHKNHVDNLFQVPTLFYAAAVCALILGPSPLMVGLAWCFVATRIVHSYIHLTYNNVLHRAPAFVLGNICLLVLWINIVIKSLNTN